MGYRTTWGNANKQTSEGLAIRYTCEPLVPSAIVTSTSDFKVTRYATKSYSFVGMDYATASKCAAAKVAQYTRAHTRVTSETSGSSTSFDTYSIVECLCSIAVQHGGGDLWNVTISVSETDEALSQGLPSDPASCFSISQDYDESGSSGGSVLTLESVGGAITSGTNATVSFTYSQSIQDFDEQALALQYKSSSSATKWTTGARQVSSTNKFWYIYGVHSGETFYFRLLYGGTSSNSTSLTF